MVGNMRLLLILTLVCGLHSWMLREENILLQVDFVSNFLIQRYFKTSNLQDPEKNEYLRDDPPNYDIDLQGIIAKPWRKMFL